MAVIDWLPARMTALGFAVVGSFEEAIDGWRFHTKHFPNDNDGVISGGHRRGHQCASGRQRAEDARGAHHRPVYDDEDGWQEPGVTPGREADVGHLRSVVGLVWRSVVVWMLLLALLSLGAPHRLIG